MSEHYTYNMVGMVVCSTSLSVQESKYKNNNFGMAQNVVNSPHLRLPKVLLLSTLLILLWSHRTSQLEHEQFHLEHRVQA